MSEKQAKEVSTSTKRVSKRAEPTYINAPKTVKAAIKRILQLECALEDVSRSFEILQYMTGRTDVGDFAKRDAEELLKDRILIAEPELSLDKMLPTVVVEDEKTGN